MEAEKIMREPDTIPELVLNYQFWKGDESPAKIYDYSGNGNTGTISGGAPYTYPGLSFNGIDQYVTVADNAALNFGTDDFSISFWVYIDNLEQSGTFFDKVGAGGIEGIGYNMNLIAGGVLDGYFLDESDAWDMGNTQLQSGYQHIVKTFTRSTGYVLTYRNGVLATTVLNGQWATLDSTANLLIGSDTINLFEGLLDDIRIYKGKALTAEEVKSIYNLQRHRYSV